MSEKTEQLSNNELLAMIVYHTNEGNLGVVAALLELQERRAEDEQIVGYKFEGRLNYPEGLPWEDLGSARVESKKTTFSELKAGERFRVVVECEKDDRKTIHHLGTAWVGDKAELITVDDDTEVERV